MKELNINDMLYTRDGRKSGNIVVVHKWVDPITDSPKYRGMSDYGNMVTFSQSLIEVLGKTKRFFATIGKATHTHKHFNYKIKYPEEFI